MTDTPEISVNTLAGHLVDRLVHEATRFRCVVTKGERGETLIDAGSAVIGEIDAGLLMAEVCLGGLGTVTLTPFLASPNWPFHLTVRTKDPVIACLGSQYAGWSLPHGEGKGTFFALAPAPRAPWRYGAALSRSRLCRCRRSRDSCSKATAAAAGSRR